MEEMLNMMKNNKGFIAALDQSGGSSGKTLKLYGIGEDLPENEEERFTIIQEIRKRIIPWNMVSEKKTPARPKKPTTRYKQNNEF